MGRVPGRSARRRRVNTPLRVDWLESRTLLNGNPFAAPLPVGMTPSLAPGLPDSSVPSVRRIWA
jgi:hypothetical protein